MDANRQPGRAPLLLRGDPATLLNDGRVLVAGGRVGCQPNGAEMYNPNTGTWNSASKPNVTRYAHTATLLPNGTVLMIDNGQHGETQIYNPGTRAWVSAGRLAVRRDKYTATLLPGGQIIIIGGVTDIPIQQSIDHVNFATYGIELYRPPADPH